MSLPPGGKERLQFFAREVKYGGTTCPKRWNMGGESDNTIRNLNERGFMVTVLSSTGGFLKKKSTTVMIGVEEDRLEEALDVLQKYAGHRKETVYQSVTMPHGEMSAVPPVPMEVMAGGAAVFIVSLDDIRKF